MITLAFHAALGPGPHWRYFLGEALRGFVLEAMHTQAPMLDSFFRSTGGHGAVAFALVAPEPTDKGVGSTLDFAVTLFSRASPHWPRIADALVRHADASSLNKRPVVWRRIMACLPGREPALLFDGSHWQAELLESVEALRRQGPGQAMTPPVRTEGFDRHLLHFATPVLVASDSEVALLPKYGQLKRPTLGKLLGSIADRLLKLEPQLAEGIGLDDKRAAAGRWLACALGPASTLTDVEVPIHRGAAEIPGLVGTCEYIVPTDPLVTTLLQWGQWLQVGQKTSYGFGRYVHQVEPLRGNPDVRRDAEEFHR